MKVPAEGSHSLLMAPSSTSQSRRFTQCSGASQTPSNLGFPTSSVRSRYSAERIVKSPNGAGSFKSEMGDVYLGRRCVLLSFSFSRRHTNYAIPASKLKGRILLEEIAPPPDNTGIISAPFYPTPSARPHSKHAPSRCSICSAHRTKCPGSSILQSFR